MRDVLIGQTDYTVLVKIIGTDGAPVTGMTEASIDIAYSRVETDNDVTTTDVTPAALANLTAAHTDWGFEEVSSTDHPGLYRLDIADAVFASGAWEAVVTIADASGTDFEAVDIGFRLVSFNVQDGVRLGLTALPDAAADAAGGLPISDAGGLDLDAKLAVATSALATPTNITAGTITTVTNLTNAPTNGDLTAAMKASVNAEADAAIETYHLDHLLAATYDPASKPGAADALLNELVENDGGVSRYTANALEEAPTGGSAPTVEEIRSEIDSNSTQLAAIVADTNELQTDWANGGRLDLIVDATLADTNELQTDWANGGRLDLIIDATLADTNELQGDWVNGGRLDLILDATATASALASLVTTVGVAGAGLTEAGGTGDHLTALAQASVCTESRLAELDPANLPADIDIIKADGPNKPTRGVQLSNFPFLMVDETDFATPETGVTVTATISKDGGAFSACANAAAEIGNGVYKITLTSGEMTADIVVLKMTGTGCAQTTMALATQPT